MVEKYQFDSLNNSIIGNHYMCDINNKAIVYILTGDSPDGSKSKTWDPLIERLLLNGIDVFIFDYCSQGLSEGSRNELTLSVASRNFLDVIETFNKKRNREYNMIGAIASSFGASVLLKVIDDVHFLNAIILKSPAVNLAEAYKNDIGEEEFEKWKSKGVSEINGLSYEAYIDAVKHDLLLYSQKIDCPVLIIHGSDDEIVPIQQSIKLYETIGKKSTLEIIEGGRHNYKQTGAMEFFIEKSTKFLKEELIGNGEEI